MWPSEYCDHNETLEQTLHCVTDMLFRADQWHISTGQLLTNPLRQFYNLHTETSQVLLFYKIPLIYKKVFRHLNM